MIVLRNIGSEVDVKLGVATQNIAAATVNGTGLDRIGFESCVLVVTTGAVSGSPTSNDTVVRLQDSADNSTFANIPAATPSAITNVDTDDTTFELEID